MTSNLNLSIDLSFKSSYNYSENKYSGNTEVFKSKKGKTYLLFRRFNKLQWELPRVVLENKKVFWFESSAASLLHDPGCPYLPRYLINSLRKVFLFSY